MTNIVLKFVKNQQQGINCRCFTTAQTLTIIGVCATMITSVREAVANH